MTFKTEFATGNDAFQCGNMELEIGKILRHIAYQIDQGYLKDDIRDTNGNVIGEFTVD